MEKKIRDIQIGKITIGEKRPLAFICGPCVIESEKHTLECAETLQKIFSAEQIPWIFKASYDKANRSSFHSFRGPGLEEGLKILEKVRQEVGVEVTTDIHSIEQVAAASAVCDLLQIPAFLCRQTDLVTACAQTGKPVSVKKGQFMAPWDMGNVVEKIECMGNENILLIERGSCFGYNNLVCDMRSIPEMHKFGYPVCFDATHAVQLPGGQKTHSGGQREHVETLAKAAVAAGCCSLFIEAHPSPEAAKSDSSTVMAFSELSTFLRKIKRLSEALH